MIMQLLSQFSVTSGCSEPQFFGLRTWYHYLDTDSQCNIVNFNVIGGTSGSDFMLIAIAIVDDLLRIAGLVAIGFIIYGGILYVTSQGSPDQTSKAQGTIQNALVGLVFAIIAVSIVTFLGDRLG